MTKKDLMKLIGTMDTAELEKIAIKALGHTPSGAVAEAVNEGVKPTPKPAKQKVSKLNATDTAVNLVANDKTVTFGNLPRDAYGVLKAKAEVLGGTYDKAIKGFVFATKASATKFAKINKVTAEERNKIRAGWGWK